MGVRLPPEYQEVEYLGNTGTQYIVTDYVPSVDNVEVDLKYMFTASQRSDSMLFGSSTGYTTAKTYQCEKYNDGNWYIAVGRSNYRDVLGEYGGSSNVIHSIHADADILKIDDGSTTPSTFRSGDNQLPMALFAWTTKADGTVAYINKGARIYAITFKENGVLTANYIPCYRKSDSKPGMYDMVLHKFYVNQGAGEFLVGPNVYRRLPAEYQEVEYIESGASGKLHVDTGIVPANDVEIAVSYSLITATSGILVGAQDDNGGNVGLRINPCSTTSNGYVRVDRTSVSIAPDPLDTVINCAFRPGSFTKAGVEYPISARFGTDMVSTIWLFCLSLRGSSYYALHGARVYSCTIWKAGTLVRRFVPCYRKSDSVAGLYDLVNGNFHVRVGSFTVGPDVIDTITPWLIARRRMLMARKPARLPAEYQEVEYLESQGAQKIRTNVQRKSGLRAKYKILFTSHILDVQQVFATNYPANSPSFYFPYISGGKWYYGYNGAWDTGESVADNTIYVVDSTLDVDNQTVIVNGNIIASGSNTTHINTTNIMSLFANDNSNVPRYAYARIYYFDVFDTTTDTQIAKFVPCYRKADNKPGMYDLITGSFLVNYNTGADFTVGPDIN